MINTHLSKELLKTTEKHIDKLASLNIKKIKDLLLYFPRTYNDTSTYTQIADIRVNEVNTLKGQIFSLFNITSRAGKKMTRGIFKDQSGSIDLIWFNQHYLTKLLPRNKEIVLTGKVKLSMGKLCLQNPQFELLSEHKVQLHTGRISPVYHETEGLNSKWIREKIKPIIDKYSKYFTEHLPEHILKEHNLININEAINQIHFPDNSETLQEARERLAFDELFLLQLKVLQKKWHWQKITKNEVKQIPTKNEKVRTCIESLDFELTNAQKKVLKEISDDLQKTHPMTRLVQGDVGSGKTIVAALAALHIATNGYQVAIMAPTEILAKQHYATFMKTLQKYNINIQFIAGSTRKKQKDDIIRQMKSGTVDIVIGTHALIQEGIGFKKLGLAIIDEQHRFGVKQRETLKSFGTPHLLSMTATPIPRTLAITIYGDQDISIIDELPAGRQEIITRIVPEKKRLEAYRWIENQIQQGRQTFIICPLIDESDKLEVKSVLQEYSRLKKHIFSNLKIELLHGKLKQEEKDKIMQDFSENKTNILVSTSVIEVGIDIPNATIMIIEGAERFGLSQLHQFRGRVGRGEHQSYCFLFPTKKESGKTRLQSMEKHSDGFKLSEIDMELRGPGEVYGVKQSGIPDLKMANLTDSVTIAKARKSAEKLISIDPLLKNHTILQEKIAQ